MKRLIKLKTKYNDSLQKLLKKQAKKESNWLNEDRLQVIDYWEHCPGLGDKTSRNQKKQKALDLFDKCRKENERKIWHYEWLATCLEDSKTNKNKTLQKDQQELLQTLVTKKLSDACGKHKGLAKWADYGKNPFKFLAWRIIAPSLIKPKKYAKIAKYTKLLQVVNKVKAR